MATVTDDDNRVAHELARDLIAAQSELHQWRTGHQLAEYQEALNEMQGRAVDAEAKLAAAEATIAALKDDVAALNDAWSVDMDRAHSAEATIARVRELPRYSGEGAADSVVLAEDLEAALAGPKDGE